MLLSEVKNFGSSIFLREVTRQDDIAIYNKNGYYFIKMWIILSAGGHHCGKKYFISRR